MPADAIICDFCRRGRVIKSTKEIQFRQLSDRGYVHCGVMMLVGVCDRCGSWSFDQGDDRMFEEAFQQAYNRLPER